MTEKCLWLLLLFCSIQTGAYLLFTFGSIPSSADNAVSSTGSTVSLKYILCFIAANILGMCCMWIMMMLNQVMNPNVVMGLTIGGGFLCGQIAIALVFRTELSILQYCGIVITTIGLFILAKGYLLFSAKG